MVLLGAWESYAFTRGVWALTRPTSGNAGLGAYLSTASGGLNGNPTNFRPVSVAGLNAGKSVVPFPTGSVSVTNYTKPLSLGKFWALLNPVDLTVYVAKQVCQ